MAKAYGPKLTLFYQSETRDGSGWVSTHWEFYDDHQVAMHRYEELKREYSCPTLRPWHEQDLQHMQPIQARAIRANIGAPEGN